MMKVALIGGCGYVGSHLCKRLAGKHEVIVVDPHHPNEEEQEYLSGQMHIKTIAWHHLFRDGEILHDVDVVVSLPGQLGSVPSIRCLIDNLNESVFPHVLLLDTLRKFGIAPLVVFPSTDLAYRIPPRDAYTANKLYLENLLRIWYNVYGVPYVALRMATGYGPMQRRDSVVNFYIRRGLENGEIPVWGDGLNRQAFIYADDMARAFEMACLGKFPVGIYPLVGHNDAIGTVAYAVSKIVGGKVGYVEFPELARKVNVGDLPIPGNPPGFQPKIGLEEGIQRTAQWMKNQK